MELYISQLIRYFDYLYYTQRLEKGKNLEVVSSRIQWMNELCPCCSSFKFSVLCVFALFWFVLVLCLVPNVTCVSGRFIHDCHLGFLYHIFSDRCLALGFLSYIFSDHCLASPFPQLCHR